MNEVELIKAQIPRLQKAYAISRLGYFGSFARGEQNISSDLDILVEFSEPIDLFDFAGLKLELEQISGRSVDLATPDAIKPSMARWILNEVIYLC